ncbi:MAG: GTP-binding protein, partial [Rhodospirillales bacterium]|nr:GTP-binding protein [Rhodospirillales bacterium]
LEEYMGALTQVYGQDMLRYKGVLFMNGSPRRMILQGVHMLMGADVGRPWGKDEKPGSKMVFIGRNLPKDAILKGLEACLAR